MNDTKRKILATALALFNQQGVTEVPLRLIADKMDISVGNLQYHFKKREEIISALYREIVERIDQLVLPFEGLSLDFIWQASGQVMSIFYEYRFFLIEFVTITRQYPDIKRQYAELSVRRTKQFMMLVDVFFELGFLRKPILNEEYQMLYRRIEILSNFWLSANLIHHDTLHLDTVNQFKEQLQYMLYPYLTEKGIKEYEDLINSKN